MDRIAVAGASGFIGRALGAALEGRFHRIGLSRGHACTDYDETRACDLFSLRDAEAGLAGVRYAVYLVHSMMPSSHLVQGRFEDLDLICADNFARAAERAGVEQIIYVGGIVPAENGGGPGQGLSHHLRSRLEVERALGSRNVPLTALRAALVIGKGGSSFEMMKHLVERLPVMVTPKWTSTRSQPIALDDLVALLSYVIGRRDVYGESFDVGGPDVLTYREMMEATAEELGVRRPMFSVPFLSPKLSTLWVSAFSGAPRALVRPLVRSLEHEMVARDRRLQQMAGIPGKPIREALREAIAASRAPTPTKPAVQATHTTHTTTQKPSNEERAAGAADAAPNAKRRSRVARSVQRLPLPPGRNAEWVAHEYLRWLPTLHAFRVERAHDGLVARFHVVGVEPCVLELTLSQDRSSPDRQLFYVTGGLLSRTGERSRLEIRAAGDGETILAAVHDFLPRLPWPVYARTQAIAHVLVMNAFGKHLARMRESDQATRVRYAAVSSTNRS